VAPIHAAICKRLNRLFGEILYGIRLRGASFRAHKLVELPPRDEVPRHSVVTRDRHRLGLDDLAIVTEILANSVEGTVIMIISVISVFTRILPCPQEGSVSWLLTGSSWPTVARHGLVALCPKSICRLLESGHRARKSFGRTRL
jgi:hypothetical protein